MRLRRGAKRRNRGAGWAGHSTQSIVANCGDDRRTLGSHQRKISIHEPPLYSGWFLIWQCRHVTIALQLFR